MRLLATTIALLLSPAAFAQHVDHSGHAAPPQETEAAAQEEEDAAASHAAHRTQEGDEKPAAEEPAARDGSTEEVDHAAMGHAMPEQEAAPVDHSQMDHSQAAPPQEAPVDHSQMDHPQTAPPEEAPVDHSQMDHSQAAPPQETPVDHSQMDHAQMGHPVPAPDQPRTPIPVLTEADRAAAVGPPEDHPVHDNTIRSFVLLDRLEATDGDHGRGQAWELLSWVGTDLDRLWVRSEGERVEGRTESADLEMLYGRAITPWWDLVAGVRHDFQPGGSQDWASVGVIGMAPYKFEVEATAYLGESGRTAARVEVEYDTLLTNRLILQWLVEAELHGKDDPARDIGSGLSTIEGGLRLRYEVRREFAPYIGIVRERAFGRTADFRRDDGEPAADTLLVAGVRVWF